MKCEVRLLAPLMSLLTSAATNTGDSFVVRPLGRSRSARKFDQSSDRLKPALRAAFAGLLTVVSLATTGQAAEPVKQRLFGAVQPAISSDGKFIAFSYQGIICRMPSEGGALTQLTRNEGWDVEPAWSPDGKRIAFINAPAFTAGPLRMIAAEDGSPVKLPKEVLARGRLQFHPDGKRLLGMFALSGQPDRLQWFDLDSGELMPIRIGSIDANQRAAMKWALSPDGATLLIATFQDRPGEQTGNNGPSTDLWRVPAAGGEAQEVTRWPSRIYGLCWDAEGGGAFVVTDRGVAYNDLWHIPFDRPLEKARKITYGQADEDWPSVSADGRWLVHTENQEGATALVRVDLKSGERQTLAFERIEFREVPGILRIVLKDAHTGEPLVARVSVKQAGGKFYFPQNALYRITSGVGHFYARRQAVLTVPAGKFILQAWHGPEYFVYKQEFDIAAGETREVEVAMDRWVNMPESGWFSGENHIHANYGYGAWHNDPVTIHEQCEGENLHVANVVVANSDGDGVFDRQYFLGRPDPLSSARTIIYWNEEFRSTIWGHLTLGNLSQLVEPIFTGFAETTNPWDVPTNGDIADRTRAQRGTVSYTHPASNPDSLYDGAYAAKGLPVDAALGRIHAMDVMGSGYEASMRLWYRLLNCGLRIPAAAGTDVFLNRINSYPPGWGRCYVKLTDGLSYLEWMDGQKAGRSFVTTGPMLEWSADRRGPGETLRLDGPRKVQVRARASSQFPIKSLEVIVNGAVVPAKPATNNAGQLVLDQEVKLESAGWVAVRCASANAPGWIGPMFGAHGNPIYVEMPGRPLDASADAKYFLAWIDRLEADLKKRDRIPVGLEEVRKQLDGAREVYRRLSGERSQ
jgi:TolB protein